MAIIREFHYSCTIDNKLIIVNSNEKKTDVEKVIRNLYPKVKKLKITRISSFHANRIIRTDKNAIPLTVKGCDNVKNEVRYSTVEENIKIVPDKIEVEYKIEKPKAPGKNTKGN